MATLLFKRGLSEVLKEKNYTPQEGEPVFETDTGRFKIGKKDNEGNLLSWNDLHYQDEATIVSYPTYYDFPKVNRLNVIYKDETTDTLYQGTGGTTYKPISSGGTIENIKIIYGGDSNGTT
jgi:hypothetical protein